MKKKLCIYTLVLFLLTIGLSLPAMAANKASGKLGKLTWTLNSDDALIISGKGEMSASTVNETYPWASYASTIKKIVINSGVTGISRGAFSFTTSATGYSRVSSISLPKTLKTIEDYAFAGCISLKSISIPAGVEEIGAMAFAGLSQVTRLSLPASVKSIDILAFYGLGITKLTLPSNLISLGEGAFFDCRALTSVTLPAKLESFGNGAFANCSKLTAYKVDSENRYFTTSGGVLFNKAKTKLLAYPCGRTGTSYTIGSKVTTIEKLAFGGAVNLTAISISAKVKSFASNAVEGCLSLESIKVDSDNSCFSSVSGVLFNKKKTTLISYPCAKQGSYYQVPSTVKTVGDYAFFNNLYLTHLCITEGVTTIGIQAFTTNEIQTFYLPSTLKEIGADAFLECNALKEICYPGSRLNWYSITIDENPDSDGNDFSRYHMVYNYTDKAPDAVTVKTTRDVSTGYVKLSWKAVSGACSYNIYRATSRSGTYSKIGTTSELSYLCTSGTIGKTYYYKVKAVSLTGLTGKYSAVVSDVRTCARPVMTVTENSKGKPLVRWKSITGAAKYEVYRATSQSGTYSKIGTTTELSYTDSTAKSGKTYYYKVKAIAKAGSAGNSTFSLIKKIKL